MRDVPHDPRNRGTWSNRSGPHAPRKPRSVRHELAADDTSVSRRVEHTRALAQARRRDARPRGDDRRGADRADGLPDGAPMMRGWLLLAFVGACDAHREEP